MTDFFLVHLIEPIKDLASEVLDMRHGNGLFHFFSSTQLVLQTAFAILHDDVLDEALLLVEGVEKLDELDNVQLSLQ